MIQLVIRNPPEHRLESRKRPLNLTFTKMRLTGSGLNVWPFKFDMALVQVLTALFQSRIQKLHHSHAHYRFPNSLQHSRSICDLAFSLSISRCVSVCLPSAGLVGKFRFISQRILPQRFHYTRYTLYVLHGVKCT